MTTTELWKSAGLTPRELQNWIENGLFEPAGMVGRSFLDHRKCYWQKQDELLPT